MYAAKATAEGFGVEMRGLQRSITDKGQRRETIARDGTLETDEMGAIPKPF